jgi:hypothetical protein
MSVSRKFKTRGVFGCTILAVNLAMVYKCTYVQELLFLSGPQLARGRLIGI